MKILFSPSKGMKYKDTSLNVDSYYAENSFAQKTDYLIENIRSLDQNELGSIFKIKNKLLDDTYSLYKNFYNQEEKEALFLYDGVSYKQLEIEKYNQNHTKYLKENIFIFSALYGISNALNKIRPYRLDMTNKILTISPYDFWREIVNEYLLKFKEEIFINIASKEFSKILDYKIFNIVDIEFRQKYGDEIKNISTEAKKARGAILNFLILNNIDSIEEIKKFNNLNYLFSDELSTENKYIFIKEVN